MPGVQFVLPLASSLNISDLQPFLAASPVKVSVISDRNHDVMSACDAAISVSGTVIMELALIGVPMVLIYKVSPLTYQIGKRVIKVAHIGICNIVAQKRVVRELIQHEATTEAIAFEVLRLLSDDDYAACMRRELLEVRVKLGLGGALGRLAGVALDMLMMQKESS
jgi:lipid-A-disaccharide synthase